MKLGRGFTLLEVLLVLTIMALGATVMVLNMGPSQEAQLAQPVHYLAAQLRAGRARAVLTQRPIGIGWQLGHYQFYQYVGEGKWRPLTAHFKPLKQTWDYQLRIDDQPIDLLAKNRAQRLKTETPMNDFLTSKAHRLNPVALVFTSDGRWPNFSLTMTRHGHQWAIQPVRQQDDQEQLVIKRMN